MNMPHYQQEGTFHTPQRDFDDRKFYNLRIGSSQWETTDPDADEFIKKFKDEFYPSICALDDLSRFEDCLNKFQDLNISEVNKTQKNFEWFTTWSKAQGTIQIRKPYDDSNYNIRSNEIQKLLLSAALWGRRFARKSLFSVNGSTSKSPNKSKDAATQVIVDTTEKKNAATQIDLAINDIPFHEVRTKTTVAQTTLGQTITTTKSTVASSSSKQYWFEKRQAIDSEQTYYDFYDLTSGNSEPITSYPMTIGKDFETIGRLTIPPNPKHSHNHNHIPDTRIISAISGWVDRTSDPIYISNSIWTAHVLDFCTAIGYKLPEENRDNGYPCHYNACHVEKKLIAWWLSEFVCEIREDGMPVWTGVRKDEESKVDGIGVKLFVSTRVCKDCRDFLKFVECYFGVVLEVVECEVGRKSRL